MRRRKKMFFLGAVRCSDNKRARTCDYSFTVRLRKWPGSDCFKATGFKFGKCNVTTTTPRLFACNKVSFKEPFYGGDEIKIFASKSHSVKGRNRGNGAAIWIESANKKGFSVCVLEYGDGSSGTAEVNWIALQSVVGSEIGTTSLNSWTTGTQCRKIAFQKRFSTLPRIFVTTRHQHPKRPQDASAVWSKNFRKTSFEICLRETKIFGGLHKGIKVQWIAISSRLKVENFTLSDTLVFTKNNSSFKQEDNAICQKINFKDHFYQPPVVLISPGISYNNKSSGSGCSAVTAWVEHTSVQDTEVCLKTYNNDANNKESIRLDYMVIGDLDPCLNVTCLYHGVCKAFGPYDARCVCIESCPSYHEPVCSSNGTTYDNKCLLEQEMCLLQLNFTLQHPGSCEGFPFQHGRLHMPHIPSLGYSHCQTVRFKPYIFYPDKSVEMQVTVNHMDSSDKSYVHDAAVSWVELVSHEHFIACVMVAGFNERKSNANVTIDWMAYQGAPVGGVAGEVHFAQWWTGTTCKTVKFPVGKFPVKPFVFVTAKHHNPGLKRDAASVWIEDIMGSSCRICLRELQNYAGSHKDIHVNWLAFSYLDKPPFSEHNSIYFANDKSPVSGHNNAFCKDVVFAKVYNTVPHVFVSANHSAKKDHQNPIHNSITPWIEYINETVFRVCVKELYEEKYDPLSISYTVLSDICPPGWGYFNGFCYLTTSECAPWLTAVMNCSTMHSHLVTVHNQEENVYIQHHHNGDNSWIGLNDRSVEGSFVWANKQKSTFKFWAPEQPNNWKNEDCVHTLGAKSGYRWDDVPCDQCYNFTCSKEIDECTTNYHRCDVNAVCQNTAGTYVCTCKYGYSGDGKKCLDVDECANNTHNCDANAVCNNTEGSYRCFCKPGYSGDGRNCSDLNECKSKTHNCDVKALCSNTKGSYKCTCKQGYSGDGKKCLGKGLTSRDPAQSCKYIRNTGVSSKDGEYWIDPAKSGKPLKVFCDMTTDVGGWLLVSSYVMQSSTRPSQLPVKNSYRGISNKQMLLAKTAMKELRAILPFTQIRFHCKKRGGRTFHITTAANSKGEAVVRYLSGQTDVQPASCGSFVIMSNDNSRLARACQRWGYKSRSYFIGKWGAERDENRLYDHPAFVGWGYHWLLVPGGRFECDDHDVGVSKGDFWKVFVR